MTLEVAIGALCIVGGIAFLVHSVRYYSRKEKGSYELYRLTKDIIGVIAIIVLGIALCFGYLHLNF